MRKPKIKYYRIRKRKDGSINHLIALPPNVEAATAYTSKSFDTIQDAKTYSLRVQEKFSMVSKGSRQRVIYTTDSVKYLWDYYCGTPKYARLAENSKKAYWLNANTALETVLPSQMEPIGRLKANKITRKMVKEFISVVTNTVSHHRALHAVKVMRLVFQAAVDDELIKVNPWKEHRIQGIPSREVVWDQGQLDRFVETADQLGHSSVGTMAMMCYYMCQRPGDMRKLTYEDLMKDVFIFTQEKTGSEVFIPIASPLKSRLETYYDLSSGKGVILINEITGLPHTRWSYAPLTRRIKKEAGLPDNLFIADLRRSGTTKLAEASVTEDELMSITGHKSREVVSVYVRKSPKMAINAINKAWGL